jgi:hypothetical protein
MRALDFYTWIKPSANFYTHAAGQPAPSVLTRVALRPSHLHIKFCLRSIVVIFHQPDCCAPRSNIRRLELGDFGTVSDSAAALPQACLDQ